MISSQCLIRYVSIVVRRSIRRGPEGARCLFLRPAADRPGSAQGAAEKGRQAAAAADQGRIAQGLPAVTAEGPASDRAAAAHQVPAAVRQPVQLHDARPAGQRAGGASHPEGSRILQTDTGTRQQGGPD